RPRAFSGRHSRRSAPGCHGGLSRDTSVRFVLEPSWLEADREVHAREGVRAEVFDLVVDRTDHAPGEAGAGADVGILQAERVLEGKPARAGAGEPALSIGPADVEDARAHPDDGMERPSLVEIERDLPGVLPDGIPRRRALAAAGLSFAVKPRCGEAS